MHKSWSVDSSTGMRRKQRPCNLNLSRDTTALAAAPNVSRSKEVLNEKEEETVSEQNPLRLLRQQKCPSTNMMSSNVLPLPPRERNVANANHAANRHQRKHPLLIPGIGHYIY